jgi:RNA polymerase sigma-70 factor (ECF subfamily)
MIVMRQAMRRIETYRGEASLFTWLCQIARGEVSRYFKRAAQRDKVVSIDDLAEARAELESLTAFETPEDEVVGERRRELIQTVLDYLPGDYGSMLEWKYVEGLSVAEIAERLDKPPLAVQSGLQRARRAFREALVGLGNEALELVAPFATTGGSDHERG